jgi:hypothetical protein
MFMTRVKRLAAWGRRHSRRLGPFIALALLVLATGYFNDQRSCQRQIPVRAALLDAARYWQQHGRTELSRTLALSVKPLKCSFPLPGE